MAGANRGCRPQTTPPSHSPSGAGGFKSAEQGGFVYEPPGEVHTLVVDEPVEEMITMFNVNGAMIYVDEKGETLGYEDVFTKIQLCRKHYEGIGLGADYVNQFIR